MTGKNAWIVLALTGTLILGCWIYSVGGVAGIAKDPVIAFSVLAIMGVIAVPIFWLNYRRWRHFPLIEELPEAEADTPKDARLEQTPLVLVASRLKILAWTVVSGAFLVFIVTAGYAQPGVCRTVSLLALGPLFVWTFLSWLTLVFVTPRLIFSVDGLTLETPWRSRRWVWNEIGQVKVAKTYVPVPIVAWFAPGGGRWASACPLDGEHLRANPLGFRRPGSGRYGSYRVRNWGNS